MLRSAATSFIVLVLVTPAAFAGSVAPAGDMALRHDIQVLADYGVISGPVTTWPISWDALAADLQVAVDSDRVLPNAVVRTMQRVIRRASREMSTRVVKIDGRVSGAAAATSPARHGPRKTGPERGSRAES